MHRESKSNWSSSSSKCHPCFLNGSLYMKYLQSFDDLGKWSDCRELTVGSVQPWHVNPSPEDESDSASGLNGLWWVTRKHKPKYFVLKRRDLVEWLHFLLISLVEEKRHIRCHRNLISRGTGLRQRGVNSIGSRRRRALGSASWAIKRHLLCFLLFSSKRKV